MFRIPDLVRFYPTAPHTPLPSPMSFMYMLEKHWRQDFASLRSDVPSQPSRQHRTAPADRRAAATEAE